MGIIMWQSCNENSLKIHILRLYHIGGGLWSLERGGLVRESIIKKRCLRIFSCPIRIYYVQSIITFEEISLQLWCGCECEELCQWSNNDIGNTHFSLFLLPQYQELWRAQSERFATENFYFDKNFPRVQWEKFEIISWHPGKGDRHR